MDGAWLHNALGNRLGRCDPEIQAVPELHRRRARQLGITEDPAAHFPTARALDATYGHVREFLFVPRREYQVARRRGPSERAARAVAFWRLSCGQVELALRRARPGRGAQHDGAAAAAASEQMLTAFQRAAGRVFPDPWADASLAAGSAWDGELLCLWWGARDAPARALEPLARSTSGPPTPVAGLDWDRA